MLDGDMTHQFGNESLFWSVILRVIFRNLFPAALGYEVYSAPNRNEYQR
jgi:hypothetical protein